MKLADVTIANGDILLFEGTSFWARAIKLRTRSVFSHAGIALWVRVDGISRLCLLEAYERVGVRLFPLDRYLEQCEDLGERAHLYQLDDEEVNRDKVAGYALEQLGKSYASPWQFFVSWGRITRWVRRVLGLAVDCDTDPDRFFCSELVAAALSAGGYAVEEDRLPAVTDPGAIALYRCLRRRGVLTA